MSTGNQNRTTTPASTSNEVTTWCGERVSAEVSTADTVRPPANEPDSIEAAVLAHVS